MAEATTIEMTDDVNALVTAIAKESGLEKSIVIERAATYFLRLAFAPETLDHENGQQLPRVLTSQMVGQHANGHAAPGIGTVTGSSPILGTTFDDETLLGATKEAINQFHEDLEDIAFVRNYRRDPNEKTFSLDELDSIVGL